MIMSEEEIVRLYQAHRGERGYTNVLAELNGCDKQEIIEVLRNNSVPIPGKPRASIKNSSIREIVEKVVSEEGGKETIKEAMEDPQPVQPINESTVSDEVKDLAPITLPILIRKQLEQDVVNIKYQIQDLESRMQEIKDFLNECN